MKFYSTALDTSWAVSLHRDSVAAVIKKATDLIVDGCLNVEVVMPDGAAGERRHRLFRDFSWLGRGLDLPVSLA
jgi:hypothetical protein